MQDAGKQRRADGRGARLPRAPDPRGPARYGGHPPRPEVRPDHSERNQTEVRSFHLLLISCFSHLKNFMFKATGI